MEGMFTVQTEQFGEGFGVASLGNAKAADGIPATNDFNAGFMNKIVLVCFPFWIHEGTLVSFPDTREPVACLFFLQNAALADHPGETTAGEAATGETKEE